MLSDRVTTPPLPTPLPNSEMTAPEIGAPWLSSTQPMRPPGDSAAAGYAAMRRATSAAPPTWRLNVALRLSRTYGQGPSYQRRQMVSRLTAEAGAGGHGACAITAGPRRRSPQHIQQCPRP